MIDTLRRLVWFGIVVTAAFFSVFVVLGNFVAYGIQKDPPAPIHDTISPGVHEMSGIVIVPLSCDELSVETQRLSTTSYQLAFKTWEDPSVDCPRVPTPRPFETFVYAPSFGIAFSGTLDGELMPIMITSDIATTSKP